MCELVAYRPTHLLISNGEPFSKIIYHYYSLKHIFE